MTDPTVLGFLGPETTFSHQALLQLVDDEPVDARPFAAVRTALDALLAAEIDGAVIPIENSVEGGVSATLDALADSPGLTIVAETVLPVRFVLCAREPVELDRIVQVSSHTHAEAQCRNWLARTVPNARLVPATSTAAAAAELAAKDPDEVRGHAALCSRLAADHFGLHVLRSDVADNPDAVTRFVRVERAGHVPERTGHDKTTVVVHLKADHSGALLDVLEQFSARGVNLSRIESRPLGDRLGRYSFSIDMEGHLSDRRIAATLMGLFRTTARVQFLGSYERADGKSPTVRPGTGNDEFAAADDWVRTLQTQIGQDRVRG